jgi:predicted 3-demethylubiquinone-9 3-methyltransferase (glyoxalase superfamily)
MQGINPFLWFKDNAEEAANFYVSIFNNARVVSMTRYGAAGPGPEGTVMTVGFQLAGQNFVALNGGPQYTFNPAVSFVVNCETQQEVDDYWDKLGAGGTYQECGWLTDRYGLSWQIVPVALVQMLQDQSHEKSKRVMTAMLKMKKLDIETLKRAYDEA